MGFTSKLSSLASNQPAPLPPAAGTHGEVVKMDRLYYKKKEIKKKCAACQAKYLAFQDIV